MGMCPTQPWKSSNWLTGWLILDGDGEPTPSLLIVINQFGAGFTKFLSITKLVERTSVFLKLLSLIEDGGRLKRLQGCCCWVELVVIIEGGLAWLGLASLRFACLVQGNLTAF